MTIASIKGGDTFQIDGERYRAMIEFHDSWGCRRSEGKSWSHEHHWFALDRKIEDYEEFTPKSLASGSESVDPVAR